MDNTPYLGARDDQSTAQKAKNYNFNEVVATAGPVTWVEKTQDQWKKFPIRDQDGSGQCVVMTYAKECSIYFKEKYGVYVEFSSSYPYQYRTSPSLSGCSSTDIYSVFPKLGNVFESFMPSQKINDAGAMSVKKESYFDDLAKVYKFSRISMPTSFELVASTLEATGRAVMVWFRFSHDEWTNMPTVLPQPTTSGHSVTVVDYVLFNGKKYLVIDDSWGLAYAMNGQRLISEEYFNARCFLTSYLMNFRVQNNDLVSRPKFDGSIASMQDCLKWEGLFPVNVDSTGVIGNVTTQALISFQLRYNIKPSLGNFGPITKGKLLALYK